MYEVLGRGIIPHERASDGGPSGAVARRSEKGRANAISRSRPRRCCSIKVLAAVSNGTEVASHAGREQGDDLSLVAHQGDAWALDALVPRVGKRVQPGEGHGEPRRVTCSISCGPWARVAARRPYGRVIGRAHHRGADRSGLRGRSTSPGSWEPRPRPRTRGGSRRAIERGEIPAGRQDGGGSRLALRAGVPPPVGRVTRRSTTDSYATSSHMALHGILPR